MTPIAVSSDGLLRIYLITYGIYDKVYFRFYKGKLEARNIQYDSDETYIKISDTLKYNFNEIMRIK
jgi:hypothetical protein